jgi:hypothetical protein
MRILTAVILFLLAMASAIMGFAIFSNASSAIHEIEALILFLIFAVSVGSLGIMASLPPATALPPPPIPPQMPPPPMGYGPQVSGGYRPG